MRGYGLPHLSNPRRRGDLLIAIKIAPEPQADFEIDPPLP